LVTHTVAIGSVSSALDAQLPTRKDLEKLDEDPVRCFDAETSKRMIAEIDECHKDGDTLGGVTETLVYGTPPGLGSFVHWDRRLDSQLAGALMGIQAIKGVEFGDGFETAKRRGSAAHDEIVREDGVARRLTDRAGGIEGGMSTGGVIRVRIAMKPISTVPKALQTIDITTGEAAKAQHQRSDVCAVPAAGVVAEAMVALVVANSVLEKFGGDSIAETKRNMESYLENIPAELRSERLS
jgi:chorismate synthase